MFFKTSPSTNMESKRGVLETILSKFSSKHSIFRNANGASKVCGVEDLGLVDNHGHFGGEPQSILAKIETESEKNKIFVFF